MKFKNAIVCGLLVTSSGFLFTNNTTVNADIADTVSVGVRKSSGIININDQFNKINNYYFLNNILNKDMGSYYLAYRIDSQKTPTKNFKVEADQVKDIKIQNLNPEFIGDNVFTNPTDVEQAYQTASYTHTLQTSVGTAVTKGFTINAGGDLTKLVVPIILPNGLKLQANVNASTTTETKTNVDTITYTAPSQPVKVPPHKKYKVEVDFIKESLAGEIPFKATAEDVTSELHVLTMYVGAGFPRRDKTATITGKTNKWYNSLSSSQKNDIGEMQFDGNDNLTVEGAATLTGIVGAKLVVNTYDITNQAKPVLVSQKMLN